MAGHDPQRTGYSTSTTLNTNETKWVSYDLGNSYLTDFIAGDKTLSPIIANGRVIITSDNNILAANSTNGKLLWSYDTGTTPSSSPVIESGRIYVCANNLQCLNETTGTLLWKSVFTHYWELPPLVSNGKIFLSAYNQVGKVIYYPFYCLNATDGSVIWQIIDLRFFLSIQIISNDILYVSVGTSAVWPGGTLYAINANTGVQIWNHSGAGIFPTYSNGKIFIKLNSSITCLDAITGALTWQAPIDAEVLAVANNRLFASGQDKFYCLNATSGLKFWDLASGLVISSASVADGKVYFTVGDTNWLPNGNTTFTCVNITTGNPIWYYHLPDNILLGSAISNGVVYVSGKDRLYAFGKNDTVTVPMSLSLSLDSETSLIGFKVILKGKLQGNVSSSVNQNIALSFSINGGQSWNDITMIPTSNDGTYSAIWQPSATGTYLVKAECSYTPDYPYDYGGSTVSGVESVRMLSVNSFDNQNVFSVASNSTVSALAFNSSSKELSFTVSGETDTTGFVDVSIAKSLITNIVDVKVYLDNVNLNYTATSTSNSWLLHFTYNHSLHNVRIDLNSQGPVISEFSSSILSLFMIITLTTSIVYIKKCKRNAAN